MRRLVGPVLVALLVTSGCSGGGDPDASPSSTTSASPTEEPSGSPTEEAPEEPAAVDPCSLLTPDELTAAGLRVDVEKSARGLVADPRVTACQVPSPGKDGGWEVFYGFSTKPFLDVFDAVEQVGTEKPQNLTAGDGGQLVMYKAYGDRYWYAFAASGKFTVMAEFFAPPTKRQADQLLSAMLERVEPDMFKFPVDLPSDCPPAKTRAITAVVGTVTNATGSQASDDVRCNYANARGLTFSITATPMKDTAAVRTSVGEVGEYFEERVDLGRGTTLFLSPGEGYAFTRAYVEKPAGTLGTDLQSMAMVGKPYRPLSYDQAAYRAAATWWSKQRPQQLG